jgi:outer membrane lipoprotein-sorting protein
MQRKILATAATIALALSGVTAANAQAKPDRLKAVLAQMDKASKAFESAEASIEKQQFEKIVNDTTKEKGTIYFLRNGKSMQVGAKFDNGQTMEYKDGLVRLYTAGTNQLTQYSAKGVNQARNEAFLTLGFGGSGSDLAKAWEIKDLGTEKMSDGSRLVEVEKLDLTSKEASVRNNFTHIMIWVDLESDISLKQVGYTPSGDTNTTIYTNIHLNPKKINTSAYAIKCKGKCS